MFPLAGKDFPTSSDELAAAIQEALSEYLTLAKKTAAIIVKGGKWPAIAQAKVDLSGAKVSVTEPPAPPKPKGKREPGITVGHLEVLAHPLRYENSKADLALDAHQVSFDFARDAKAKPILVLKDANDGHIELTIAKDDIQSLLLAVAGAAAKPQGITIQELQANLASQGPRSIGGEVRVKARKLMMSGTLTVRGKVDIDDDLVATLSNLSCSGEGVIGSMAAAFLQGKLNQADGKRIPLMAFSLGDVSLADVKISTKNGLHLSADFGHKR